MSGIFFHLNIEFLALGLTRGKCTFHSLFTHSYTFTQKIKKREYYICEKMCRIVNGLNF